MSRQALLLILLVVVLGAQARSQRNGKRKSGRRAVLAQQPAPGGDADNTDIYNEYYEEYDGYDEYENGGWYYCYYCLNMRLGLISSSTLRSRASCTL
jgi:hypothetical protein